MVSVVVTCYNYGKYLANCLNSVLSQTYTDYEIIVVDDGSTDNTAEVIKVFLTLPNFKYIFQGNAGQAHAKNVGIENSSGEFVAFLDADDAWAPTKIEKQMRCFEDPAVGVVFCRANYLDAEGRMIDYEMTGDYLQPRRGRVTDWLIFDNFVQFSSSVVRAECLERFHGFDESIKMGIDWDLWLGISIRYSFDYVSEPLFYYRMGHAGQMSKNLEERHRCSDFIMGKFLKSYPHAVAPGVLRKARSYTSCGRGDYFRGLDPKRANAYYWDAIKNNPMGIAAYKGVLKNLLKRQG
jgi:glycosyltransferase involved in cell wall biosynthesis